MTEDAASRIAARLADLWRASRPSILERVGVLHSACEALTTNPADAEARSSGLEAAHKLAGVLGMFGMPQGSELASLIEFQLKPGEPLTAEGLSTLRDQIAALDAIVASRAEN